MDKNKKSKGTKKLKGKAKGTEKLKGQDQNS